MHRAFSLNREFDFVRLDGLRRATGQPPHEWDLYIVKELIDNALDADEVIWGENPTKFPWLSILVKYMSIPERQLQQLFIQVSNRSSFPEKELEDIFATQWYTSRKAFIKGLTRGTLGNALKTLLGIPYALRNRVAEDWSPQFKPMSIRCNAVEYLPRYFVNTTNQTVRFECEKRERRFVRGTVISVGLDHFMQERPRKLEQIKQLAQQYYLCNPHARFTWKVEINGQDWIQEYGEDARWADKFRSTAPVQWYSLNAFQNLLGALYRKQCSGNGTCEIPIEAVCCCFLGFDSKATSIDSKHSPTIAVMNEFGQNGLTESDIEGKPAVQLYQILRQHSPRVDSHQLGCIGLEHIRKSLFHALSIEGEVLYKIATNSEDNAEIPFLIEMAVARIKEGKRRVWTAINFSPTYDDPFQRRWLRMTRQPNDLVLGLRGLLDAYGLRGDTDMVLFMHLVCPNVEHHEFSKTEIDHLPFKQVLSDLLDQLLTDFSKVTQEEELRLKDEVFGALTSILNKRHAKERFIDEQLLAKLVKWLSQSQDQAIVEWLKREDAKSRLLSYIAQYKNYNTTLIKHVARPIVGTLSIPVHPSHHFSVSVEHVSENLLTRYHVNKILYVQEHELEPVIIENGWLCQMDMALLCNLPSFDALQVIMPHIVRKKIPFLVLHNADEDGSALVEQMRIWEKRYHNVSRIIDLGLDKSARLDDGSQVIKLVEMMPIELVIWLLKRFKALDIPAKSLPSDTDICRNISDRFEWLLRNYLLGMLSQNFEITYVIKELDKELNFTNTMIDLALDQQLKTHLQQELCAESYNEVLDSVVGEFFKAFTLNHNVKIQNLVHTHTRRVQSGGNN